MNIALSGYGRMGRLVEEIALRRGHTVVGHIDIDSQESDLDSILGKADMVVEFAHASGVKTNARRYLENGCAAVVGTTGWGEHRQEIRSLVDEAGGSYLWGSNFSPGAHVMFALSEQLARISARVEGYDIFLSETHHRQKVDYPSGTALTIAERVLANSSTKQSILKDPVSRAIREDEFVVASIRGGAVPGIHSLTLDGEADSVTLTHSARNRGGFATGAVMAAEWLMGRSGFFSVDDFMAELLSAGGHKTQGADS